MPEDDGTAGQEPEGPDENPTPWTDQESATREIEKLRRENAGWRTRVRDLEPLARKAQEQDEAAKSEVQKALDRAAQAEQAAQVAQLEAARLRAAAAHGLTETQARRLVGSTPEELEADAREYAKELGANTRRTDMKQGARGPATANDDLSAWIRKAAGR